MELRDVLLEATVQPNSNPVRVFLLPSNSEADGSVRLNKEILNKNKGLFEEFLKDNVFEEYTTWSLLMLDKNDDVWARSKDEVLMLMAALDILDLGTVVNNGPEESSLVSKGIEIYPILYVKILK